MAIDFNQKRWEKVKNKYRKWWAGKLAHPICGVELISQDSTKPQPPAPQRQSSFTNRNMFPGSVITFIKF